MANQEHAAYAEVADAVKRRLSVMLEVLMTTVKLTTDIVFSLAFKLLRNDVRISRIGV